MGSICKVVVVACLPDPEVKMSGPLEAIIAAVNALFRVAAR
jgi:hypothetical protein